MAVAHKDIGHIFRSYDVRGIVGQDLDEHVMWRIGMAFGSYIKKDIVIAGDVRLHSPALKNAFITGFLQSGNNMEDAGTLPLGAGMFHAWQAGRNYAYVTGSHLPKEWNGVKFFHASGAGFIEEENKKVRDVFFAGGFLSGNGHVQNKDSRTIIQHYKNYLIPKLKFGKSISVVLDCGNGCAGLIVPELFSDLGCKVKTIFEEIDGNFPNRIPDPQDFALAELKRRVIGHDLGIGYDGDGDRTALVDDRGEFLPPEETSFLILSELLKHEKGDIVANVECTRLIDLLAQQFNRRVIRVPVGHTFMMDAVHRHSAVFGVESAAHYALPSLVPFDDAMVIGLYAGSVLSRMDEKLSEFRKRIPKKSFSRVSFECPDSIKFGIINAIAGKAKTEFNNISTMDGVRIDVENGWALIRASNTSPYVRLTVEGETEKDMSEIQAQFLEYLKDEMQKHDLELIPEHK